MKYAQLNFLVFESLGGERRALKKKIWENRRNSGH